jgi:hypothetical protein
MILKIKVKFLIKIVAVLILLNVQSVNAGINPKTLSTQDWYYTHETSNPKLVKF